MFEDFTFLACRSCHYPSPYLSSHLLQDAHSFLGCRRRERSRRSCEFAARIGSKSTVVPSQPGRTMTPVWVVPVRTYTRSCTVAASLRFPPAGWYQIQLPQHSYQVVVLRSQGRALGSRLVRISPRQIRPSPISSGCYTFRSQAHLPIPLDAGPSLLDENPPGVSEHLHLRIGLLSPPQRELMRPIARA